MAKGMPTLTRCRSKTPEALAMKASPCAKKLKKAAKNLKEKKKDKAVDKTSSLKTPSPKPILKTPPEVPGVLGQKKWCMVARHAHLYIYIHSYINLLVTAQIS